MNELAMVKPEVPCRRRFQIHLSTAVVMMFVAGGILWANTKARFVYSERKLIGYNFLRLTTGECISKEYVISEGAHESELATRGAYEWRGIDYYAHGWPVNAAKSSKSLKVFSGGGRESHSDDAKWNAKPIVLNTGVAVVILVATAGLSEWLIRRRAVRKGP